MTPRATPSATTVLIVDADPASRRRVRAALEAAGHDVVEAPTATEATTILDQASPNPGVVILALALPDQSAFDVLHDRPVQHELPVIVLTAADDEDARVQALDLGAADAIGQPFGPRELAARVRAAQRHFEGRPTSVLVHDDLRINLAERTVTRAGRSIELTRREFDLLAYLASAPRRAVSRGELLEHVWQSSHEWQDPATVTEHLRRLRHKLEDDPTRPRWLHTVRGVGYQFDP